MAALVEKAPKSDDSEKRSGIDRDSVSVSAGTSSNQTYPWNAPHILRLNACIASCVLLGSFVLHFLPST
jgi:hypothetical protein